MARRYNYRYQTPFNLDDMDRQKESIHSVPFWIGILVIICLWGIFGVVYLLEGSLPTGLNINDEVNYPDSFISERAIQDLKSLVDLGPRITGSYENEYVVIDFLTRKINTIIAEAHPNQYIELDIQTVTGGYCFNTSPGFMNAYDRVQNVIVKLHGQNNASEHSILVNCHFDVVPSSPGGADDGINVANMLEILRKLSNSEERQLHNIIFLFNGAEETPMQASHGFIAHHKWSNESKVIVNLEAAGSEGKLVLFQTGPENPWLVKYYSKVPYPFGAVSAEEIFQSGIMPSDTDFRHFRDYGNMVGVDMAYYRNGYRYHTSFDGASNIPDGSYQHGGENSLSLVRSLANAPEVLEEEGEKGQTVFFDVFGWFMIYYSNQTALIINWITVVLSVGTFIISVFSFKAGMTKSIWKFFLFTIVAILCSWIITVLFVIGQVYLLDILSKTMSWYGRPWFVFGLYIVPIIALSGCLMSFTNHRNLSLGIRAQLQAHLLRLLLTLFLILGTVFNIRSIYIVMIPVLFNTLGLLIIHLFRLHCTVRTWQVIYVSSLVIPIAYLLYQMWTSLLTFIPITGRLGSPTNPELYIAVICLLFTFLAITPLTVISNLLRRGIWYYLTLLATFLVFFGLLFSPLGFPYVGDEESPRPQRHWILHTQRQFYDETFTLSRTDSGIMMVNMDRNSPNALKPYVRELSNITSIEEDCAQYTLCAMPLIHSKVVSLIKYVSWIPTSAPTFPANETLALRLLSKEQISLTQIKYSVEIRGPDKLIFYLTPKLNTSFVNMTLIDMVQPSTLTFEDRPVYVILYQLGKGEGTPLTFNFTMVTSEDHVGPTIDFAVSARYVHDSRTQKTTAYLDFLNQFPDWANVIAWVGAYQSYVL